MTALFNASRGSVLVVVLFHGTLDILMTSPTGASLQMTMGALMTIAGFAILGTRAALISGMSHEIVWIDHREARVLHVGDGSTVEHTVAAPNHLHHRHPKRESGAKEHPDDARKFFQAISKSLSGATHILLVGPSSARLELAQYAHDHDHALEARIVGGETVDHPTDAQLAAYAKQYFKLPDASAAT